MKTLGGVGGIGQRKKPIRRDWSEARAKVEDQGCRVCGDFYGVQAAHVVGRTHDDKPPLRQNSRWRPYVVAKDRVVGLCPAHHREYDSRRLDLLPHLTEVEQAQAVMDAGGIFAALARLMPSESPKRVA